MTLKTHSHYTHTTLFQNLLHKPHYAYAFVFPMLTRTTFFLPHFNHYPPRSTLRHSREESLHTSPCITLPRATLKLLSQTPPLPPPFMHCPEPPLASHCTNYKHHSNVTSSCRYRQEQPLLNSIVYEPSSAYAQTQKHQWLHQTASRRHCVHYRRHRMHGCRRLPAIAPPPPSTLSSTVTTSPQAPSPFTSCAPTRPAPLKPLFSPPKPHCGANPPWRDRASNRTTYASNSKWVLSE